MQKPRRSADAVVRVAAIEDRRGQSLAGIELVTEVERIVTAGDTNLLELILLDGDAPRAAPRQCAEPYLTRILDPMCAPARWQTMDCSGAPSILAGSRAPVRPA